MKKLLSALLAVTMLLAMGSGLVLFTSSADNYVKMPMPGFDQYTPEQMGQMAKRVGDGDSNPNYEFGSNWSFSKDADGHTIITVTVPAEPEHYGTYTICFATGDKYDQWRKNKLIGGLSPFGDVDLSNKLGFKFKIVNVGENIFNGTVGFCFGSSTKKIAIDFRAADRDGDYYVVRWAKTGWYGTTFVGGDAAGGWWRDCQDIPDTYYGGIDQFQMKLESPASLAGKTISFYIDDFHAYGSVDSTELGRAIFAAKDAGLAASLIDTAETTYKAAEEHTQAEIDAITKTLNDKIDELKYGVGKAREDLDDLLVTADDLGFFDSTYPHYEDVTDADLAYSDPNASLETLRYYVKVVRLLVAEELFGDDFCDALELCVNAWQHNYTDKSYKALLSAVDEAWELANSNAKSPEDDAAAILNAAYDALEPLPVKTITADFFDGWTTTQVNDVVDANSGRLCDSIGDGKNTKDVWNNGDFSNNTTFEADSNLALTALGDFSNGSMGWKNMDRSKTLQTESNGAFPPIDATGLSKADGVRLKIEATGSVDRILIGLSNCSTMTREQYALRIKPEFVGEDGYINIPFSYFENAWWCNAFAQDELEKVIVLIFECYGVEEDTTVTFSDFRGYTMLEKASAADAEKLDGIVAKLEAFDIDGKYADLIAEAGELSLADNYTSDYEEMYDEIFAVLKDYGDPSAAIVDVPGLSIFTQEEMNEIPFYDGGGCTMIKTERGMKHSLSNGSWAFVPARMIDPETTGYGEHDCFFCQTEPINGKDITAMFGGYSMNEIYGFSVMVENPASNADMNVSYKDGVGLWSGMLTASHYAYPDEDGRYTWIIDEAPVGKGAGGWYGDVTLERIRTTTKYLVCSFYKNVNKDIYGWQVILYKSIDRSALKDALVSFKDLGLDGYKDAMDVYYDKNATEQQIADAAAALVAEATPEAPSAPVLREVTYNSVTLESGAKNIEFRCNDGEWTSLNVFEGLEPDTEYSFYARVMAIGVRPASEPSKALVVRTNKAPIKGEVVIEGEAAYGATLTATATVTSENPGELTYVWSRANALEAVQVGTGTEYVVAKEDIGATLSVSVTAANLEGSIVSESTAEVTKATPNIIKDPVPAVVLVGEKIGTAAISGAEVDVPGTWSWVDPEIVPTLTQSGSTFAVVFTPEDTDCYFTVDAYVVVTISSNTTQQTVTDDASGLSVTGDFITGVTPDMTVAEITPANSSYIALLRAARNSDAANNLILFKNVSFSGQCYVGKLQLTAQLSSAKAGMEYTVWFFANGEVCSSTGIVDAYGVITVTDFVADVA